MVWVGGLGVGAGEALSSGQSLTAKDRSGPPVRHVIQALDMTAAALAGGRPVLPEAVTLIARNPIPLLPFAAWRWLFGKAGTRHWYRQAAENGMRKAEMIARPYAE